MAFGASIRVRFVATPGHGTPISVEIFRSEHDRIPLRPYPYPDVLNEKKLDINLARTYGTKLFLSIFQDQACKQLYRRAFASLPKNCYGILAIEIPNDCHQLRDLPWEVLSEDESPDFLIADNVLVVLTAGPVDPFAELGLKDPAVLLCHRNPRGLKYRKIPWENEFTAIQRAVGSRIKLYHHPHLVAPDSQQPNTILHVVCHGAMLPAPGGGENPALIDATRWGSPVPLPAATFATQVFGACNNITLPLIVINSCLSAARSKDPAHAFRNFPDMLANPTVAHFVICNTYNVKDSLAEAFSETFYQYLAQGRSVAASMVAARLRVKEDRRDLIDWAFPRLLCNTYLNAAFLVPLASEPRGPFAGNTSGFYKLHDQLRQTEAIFAALSADTKIRPCFKEYLARDYQDAQQHAKRLLNDKDSEGSSLNRLARKLRSQQARLIRLLAFRASLSDNLSRGAFGSVLGAVLGLLLFWVVLISSASNPAAVLWAVQLGIAERATDEDITILNKDPSVPLADRLKISDLQRSSVAKFLTTQWTQEQTWKCIAPMLVRVAIVGTIFGAMRYLVATTVGFRWPGVYLGIAVLAAIAAMAVIQSIPRLTGAPPSNVFRTTLLCIVVALGVTWIVASLRHPTRLHRSVLAFSIGIVAAFSALGIFVYESKMGVAGNPIRQLYVVLEVATVTSCTGYMLSRS